MNSIIPTDKPEILYPDVLEIRQIADGIVLAMCISKELAYFAGHFEQIPIVPGVVQIQWAVRYAERYLGLRKAFSHMEAVKFKELLLPGQPFELSLRYLQQACKLDFRYHAGASEFSSGRIYFHDAHD